jgi:hypothetical protein
MTRTASTVTAIAMCCHLSRYAASLSATSNSPLFWQLAITKIRPDGYSRANTRA